MGRSVRVALVAALCLAGAACSLKTEPTNSLLSEVSSTDLGAQHPSRVKQPVGTRQGDQGSRQPSLYPGDERTAARSGPGRADAPRNAVASAGDGYQLNFEEANVADVVKAVLGDTLRMQYVIDPRVQGQVTVSTGRSVTRGELIKVLETALKLHNGALVAEGAGFRVVPVGEAAAGDVGKVRPLNREEGATPGYGVTVMPLRHVAAEAMIRLLEGFMVRAGSVRAELAGNLLLIRGTSRERDHIVDVVDTFDVDWLKGQSAGVFPLTHASPDAIIQELTLLMQSEQPTLSANMVRFQAITRLNAVLVLARRFEHLQMAGSWIRRLDRSSSAGHQHYVYQVENGKAADIAQLLNDMFGSGGATVKRSARSEVAPGRDVTRSFSASVTAGEGKGAPAPGMTARSQAGEAALASPAAPPPPIRSASARGDPEALDVRIIADEANNSLLIRATLADYQRILATLRQIDRPPLQVLINATIAEVTLNNALRYGVQAYLKFAHGAHGSVGYHAGPQELTLDPSFPGLNLLIGKILDPRVVLDALSNVTTVKVVSSPSLVVVDNQPATLKVGDEVPIATQQVQSVIDAQSPLINTIRFRETGVILKVTPRVNSSGLVTMDVEQEISQVANNGNGAAAATLTPTISQRRIASTISVYSGQTVVLGGLISEQDNTDKKSVPIINRVPLVGDLLGKTQVERRRTELIVFIRPQVIRNSQDASRLSHEMRDKLRSMAFEPEERHHRRGWEAETRSIKDGDGTRADRLPR